MKRAQVLLFLAILALCAGCDHVTKFVAQSVLEESAPVSIGGDTIRFELVSNAGAFLSLGSRLPPSVRGLILIGLVPAALAALCLTVLRSTPIETHSLVAVGLVTGGGFSNWIDRVMNGGTVTDFVSLGLGPVRTGIFNLADTAILLGIAVLLLSRGRKEDDGAPLRAST